MPHLCLVPVPYAAYLAAYHAPPAYYQFVPCYSYYRRLHVRPMPTDYAHFYALLPVCLPCLTPLAPSACLCLPLCVTPAAFSLPFAVPAFLPYNAYATAACAILYPVYRRLFGPLSRPVLFKAYLTLFLLRRVAT